MGREMESVMNVGYFSTPLFTSADLLYILSCVFSNFNKHKLTTSCFFFLVQPEEHTWTLTDTFPVSESTHFVVVVFPESFLKATDSGALMSRHSPCVVPFPTFLHLQDVPQVTEGVRNVSSSKLSMTLCCGYVEPQVEKGTQTKSRWRLPSFFFFLCGVTVDAPAKFFLL